MPPLVAAVGAAVSAWAASFSIPGILMSLASSIVMSGLQKLLMPQKKSGGGARSVQETGITQTVRNAIINRRILYGEQRVSGGVVFIGMSDNNKYMHLLIALAGHEVAEIGEVWLNDVSIAPDNLDADGIVQTGRFATLVRIRKYLGTASQNADTFLDAEVADWTSNHKLSGIAYLYVRLEWDADIFPTGVPNISAWVRGKKVYDPRTTLTTYSDNVALIVNDYLQWEEYGIGAAQAEVDDTYLQAAANACDEMVTVTDYPIVASAVANATDLITLTATNEKLFFQRGDRVQCTTTGTLPTGLSLATNYYVIPYQRKDSVRIKLASSYANAMSGTAIDLTTDGTGTLTITKNAEPRFAGSCPLDSASTLGENLRVLLSGMLGFCTYSGGVWRMVAGVYQTPTLSFGVDDLVSPISLQTKLSKRERFNTVRGVYVSPINSGEPTDYPQVKNATYISQDNGETIPRQVDMDMPTRPHMCQRMAKILLELSRQELNWSADFNLKALQLVAGENAYFTFAQYGWSSKIFQVKSWELATRVDNDVAVPVVHMELREIASANYDWNNGEETSVDPSPNTDLPNVYTVQAVTGLAVSSEVVDTQGGDYVFKVLISWTPSVDQFVVNGGYYEISYKLSAESEWRQTYLIDGALSFAEVTLAAQLNTNYDVRIRAVNSLGVHSSYSTLLNYEVGTSGGVGATNDWGDWTTSITASLDWGDWTTSITATNDWGFFT